MTSREVHAPLMTHVDYITLTVVSPIVDLQGKPLKTRGSSISIGFPLDHVADVRDR